MNVDSPPRINVQEALLQVKNDTNEDYKDHLRSAIEFVLPDDAPSFFASILDSFNNKNMLEEAGLQVFKTIRAYLQFPEFFDILAHNKYLLQLPFDTETPSYIEQIFNIAYDIIQINPSKIQSPFGDQDHFTKVVAKDPLKGLSIIHQFANKVYCSEYEGTADPWTLIDILFNSYSIFMNENQNDNELLHKFGYVVIYILKTYPDYRNQRLSSYWKLFSKSLEKFNDPNSLYSIYNFLCFLKEMSSSEDFQETEALVNDLTLPLSMVVSHLHFEKRLRSPIFSLLALYSTTNPELLNDSELILELLSCSKKSSIKASLILMNISSVQEIAKIVLSHSKKWLERGIPDPIDTLRLFLVIFQHLPLHEEIVKNKRFVPFLIFVLKNIDSREILPIVNLILSRINITPSLFAKLRNSELTSMFINIANKYDDDDNISAHAVLEFMGLLLKHGAAEDLLNCIPYLSNIKKEDELKNRLCVVIYKMAKASDKCASGLVDAGFREFCSQLVKETSSEIVKKSCNRFLKLTRE